MCPACFVQRIEPLDMPSAYQVPTRSAHDEQAGGDLDRALR